MVRIHPIGQRVVRVSEHRARTGVLVATCVSTLVVNANTSAVAILLPAISDDTGAPISTLQWAVTGYSLVGAACIVTSGALGDVMGRRKVFLGGLALFIGSCVLIALSTSGLGVVLGRCIQGASGSTILACGLSLLTLATDGPERLRAVALWGAASAVGAAAGPLVGGLLVDSTGWQGLFWIDAAIAALLVPVTLRAVTESRDPDRSPSIDWLGTALVALVLAPLILGFSKGADWGWTSPATWVSFGVSVASAFGFLAVERRSPAPLVDLALLRNALLIGSTVGILIGAGTINGLMFVMSLYFQDPATLGLTPLQAGLATLPATVGLVLFTPLVPKLATKWGSRTVILIGFIAMTAGFVLFLGVDASWTYTAFIIPIVLVAAGMAFSNGPCSAIGTSSVPEEQVGSASGISNMARYVGAAVVTAIVAAVYGTRSADQVAGGAATDEALASAFVGSSLVLAVISASGIALALLVARHRPPPPLPIDLAANAASTSHTLPVPRPNAPERHLASAP
jgi:EmrB/QacA subfamily drug resistance transporter